mmetsp:Transcript_57833/g.146714  ORF Transcript_57833/g.146714 Transcript_57833/m.146714 type:complete len:233 (+) Transcript_57833:728-1426(+)
MQRHVLVLEELCDRVHRRRTSLGDLAVRQKGVVCEGLHAEALGKLLHGARHGAEAVERHRLPGQLEAARAVVVVAGARQHHAEDKLCNCIGVLPGGVHGHHVLRRGRFQVNVVVSRTRPYNDLQLRRSIEHRGIHYVAPDDHGIHILDALEQLGLGFVVLELFQRVLRVVQNLYDLTDSIGREGFLRCKQDSPGLARQRPTGLWLDLLIRPIEPLSEDLQISLLNSAPTPHA